MQELCACGMYTDTRPSAQCSNSYQAEHTILFRCSSGFGLLGPMTSVSKSPCYNGPNGYRLRLQCARFHEELLIGAMKWRANLYEKERRN